MDSMRAIVQHEFGGPDVLRVESRAVPEPRRHSSLEPEETQPVQL